MQTRPMDSSNPSGGDAGAPRFSVVVPVHRVQGYLRECLDSILEQSFRRVEVIAVDDCSPDSSGAILDEYAARDPRVIPVHKEVNGGIGAARNTGVEKASGDYILFLDGDDTFAAGALQAIADRLDATEDPEILLYDHVRTYWDGKRQSSAAVDLLGTAGEEVFSPLHRTEYLEGIFAVVWNRAFRRDFYLAGGFGFTSGLYEDALFVYKTMLTATRVAALGRVCVEYRQRRQGNSMRTPGREHFTIFDQYGELFDFVSKRSELDVLRPMLFGRMVDHFLFALARETRVAPADRPEFFRRAHQYYRRYLPSGYTPPPGLIGMRVQLLGRGSYPAFQAMKLANKSRKTATKLVRETRKKAGRTAYERLYRIRQRQPIDPNLAVFAAYWHRGVACNPGAIYYKARELAPQVHGVWVVRKGKESSVPKGVDHVVLGSPRYWDVMARAKYLVNNVNFPDEIVKRPGQIHLQTHHGTPLKKMGIDQADYPAAAKGMSFYKLLKRADRWDYSVSSNQHTTEVWERVYPCAFTSLDTGYPRNDVYYTAGAAEVAAAREKIGIPEGKTAILYAPTVRDYQRGYVPRLDLERITQELGEEYVLLVRTHYFYGANPELARLQERGKIVDVSQYPVVEELCLASDALITDYSSIMFDYANLDRPIISYIDDWEVYAKARGVYFDLSSGEAGDTPGVIARDEDELIEAFRTGMWKGSAAGRLRAAFRERFCQFDDGYAAERVVRSVFLREGTQNPAIVPVAERKPAPAPAAGVVRARS